MTETREQILDRAIRHRRLSRLNRKRYFLYEDGICVHDGYANSEQEFEDNYRKQFNVTADGNWHIERVS